MNDFELILDTLSGIVEYYLTDRKEYSLECLLESPTENGQTAFEIFLHAIKVLYQFSFENFEIEPNDLAGVPNDELIDIPEDDYNLPLYLRIIKQYKKASELFSTSLANLSKEAYSNCRKKIGTLVLHTVLHIGMALRIQKQYIDNNLIISSYVIVI